MAVASRLVLVYGAGAAIGPFAASVAMTQVGPSGLYGLIATVLGLLTLVGLVRVFFRPPVPSGRKRGFVIIPRTTHAALRMHRQRQASSPDGPRPP